MIAADPPEAVELLRHTLEEVRDLGVILFALDKEEIVFQNREAGAILASAGVESSYAALAALLLAGEETFRPGESRSFKRGDRTIGFTVYGTGDARMVFCRDVSEKARATSIGEALELMSGFEHLFLAVRHELGNPINSLKTALTVLRTGYDRFPRASVLDYLDRCLAEISRVEELLATLKRFSMVDAPRCEAVDVAEILQRVADISRESAAAGGAALDVSVGEGVGAAEADPLALRRVLRGLVADALSAVSGRPFARVTLSAAAREAIVEIRVRDNGRGLTPAERRDLFLPFAARGPGRPGMDLVIARKLLAEMNGTIEIESEEGAGTTARVTLRRSRGAS